MIVNLWLHILSFIGYGVSERLVCIFIDYVYYITSTHPLILTMSLFKCSVIVVPFFCSRLLN